MKPDYRQLPCTSSKLPRQLSIYLSPGDTGESKATEVVRRLVHMTYEEGLRNGFVHAQGERLGGIKCHLLLPNGRVQEEEHSFLKCRARMSGSRLWLQEEKFQLDSGKYVFIQTLSVDAMSPGVLRSEQDAAQSCSYSEQRCWSGWPSEIPLNVNECALLYLLSLPTTRHS